MAASMKALCCRVFSICRSPDDFIENYQHFVIDKNAGPDANGNGQFYDIEKLFKMLKYIGYRVNVPGAPAWHRAGNEQPCYFYTCRYITQDGCSNYEWRPDMCRGYPRYSAGSSACCGYPECESAECEFHQGINEWHT